MIEERYVNFETARLLREKGFDIPVRYEYHSVHNINQEPQFHRHLHNFNGEEYGKLHSKWYSAPTHQMAMKWLREVHNIFIQIELYSKHNDYCFELFRNTYRLIVEKREVYNSYEEACEAAILYCLENLI